MSYFLARKEYLLLAEPVMIVAQQRHKLFYFLMHQFSEPSCTTNFLALVYFTYHCLKRLSSKFTFSYLLLATCFMAVTAVTILYCWFLHLRSNRFKQSPSSTPESRTALCLSLVAAIELRLLEQNTAGSITYHWSFCFSGRHLKSFLPFRDFLMVQWDGTPIEPASN